MNYKEICRNCEPKLTIVYHVFYDENSVESYTVWNVRERNISLQHYVEFRRYINGMISSKIVS